MTTAGGYKGYVLKLRRDKNNTRILEIFGPACSDFTLSTAASVAEAVHWIDDYTDLEQTIADLIDRKKNLPEDSAEYQLIERELRGLRYSSEYAGGIMEDLDHFGWGGYCRPLESTPATEPRQVLPFRKRSQQKQDSEELKERELRKLDPRRQDLVRRIVESHPETKWDSEALQRLHDDLDEWRE